MLVPEAFESIDEMVKLLLQEEDESTATEILQTIIELAKLSETTEVSESLRKERNPISRKFGDFGEYANVKLQELLQYYRM